MAQAIHQAGTGPRTERELTAPVDLCDASGRLNPQALGWSRQPLHWCNLRGHPLRKKRWNYWAVTSDRYLFSATVADVDYMSLAFVYFLEFETGRFVEKTVSVPFRSGAMADIVYEDASFRHKRLGVTLKDDGSEARIEAAARSFGGQPLRADIQVERPAGHETLNVVVPWSRDRFQFTSKQSALPAHGVVEIGGERFDFEEGKSFAVLDYGRGVWKFSTFWNWGAASGLQNGQTIGLNLGGGWTDGTGATENGVCVAGRLHKIHEDLAFVYDRRDLMKPWEIRTVGSDRVDLRLVPFFERVAKTNLVLLKSEVHQVFGHYHGSIVKDDGERLQIDGLLGWVEQHEARW